MTVNTIKVKNKNDLFLDLPEVMGNCKMSGKSQGILKWMISGHPGERILSLELWIPFWESFIVQGIKVTKVVAL